MQLSLSEAAEAGAAVAPINFICPISKNIMVRPTLLLDGARRDNTDHGHNYEESDISRWLDRSNADPLTNELLETPLLVPNRDLRQQIEDWALANNVQLPAPEKYLTLRERLSSKVGYKATYSIIMIPECSILGMEKGGCGEGSSNNLMQIFGPAWLSLHHTLTFKLAAWPYRVDCLCVLQVGAYGLIPNVCSVSASLEYSVKTLQFALYPCVHLT